MRAFAAGFFSGSLLMGLLPLGCGSKVVPDDGAGLEWVQVAEAHSALISLLYEGATTASTSELAAEQAAASVKTKLGTCVEATVEVANVKYTFTDCKELPYGLSALSGVLSAKYEVSTDYFGNPEFVLLAVEGQGVSMGDVTLEVEAQASNVTNRTLLNTSSTAAEVNEIAISATSAGTSKEGNRFTMGPVSATLQSGVVGVYADSDRCADFDETPPSLETAGGTIESRGSRWIVQVQGFRRCGESCPEAGAFVAVVEDDDTKAGKNTPSFLRFDGSATARLFDFWAGAGDDREEDSQPFALGCSPMK